MAKIAALQMSSTAAVGTNLLTAQFLIQRAVEAEANMVVLPENFAFVGANENDVLLIKEQYGRGRIQDFIAEQARLNKVWIVGGTIPIVSADESRAYACSIVWNANGEIVGAYNKNHIMNVDLGGLEHYNEASYLLAGNELIVVDTPIGKLGLASYADLYYSGHFKALKQKGAEIISVVASSPSAMGSIHWRPLIKARSIENQCYCVGANQYGLLEDKRYRYGHSMITGPWGRVLGVYEAGMGYCITDLDLERLHFIRDEFPIIDND